MRNEVSPCRIKIKRELLPRLGERISGRTTRPKGVSPGSEKIEPACAKHKRRNFSSEKEIQDKVGKGNGMTENDSLTGYLSC